MTLADLRIIVRERARSRAREIVQLSWRSAYYQRVKHMPKLVDELDDVEEAFGVQATVASDGSMSAERHAMIKSQIRAALIGWNAKFEAGV